MLSWVLFLAKPQSRKAAIFNFVTFADQTLLQMQFLNPFVLFGLLALVIPVLIHLFNFKKPKRVYFTNVRFLRELKLETRRRSQLKHLIILLMRLLAFAAIIIAFAMPVRKSGGESIPHGKPLIVVYIDNSFSMQAPGSQGLLFESAVRNATEVAGFYNPSDEFYLITNDFSPAYSRIVNRSDFNSLVTSVQYSPLSRSAEEIFERVEDISRRNPARQILFYMISDFQSSTIDITFSEPDIKWETFLLPLNAVSLDNLYIDSVWMDIPVVRPGQIVEFTVRVGNAGSSASEDIPVTLTMNGREAAVGTVSVAAGSKENVILAFRIPTEGNYHGVIIIDDHPVIFDDRFHISLKVSQQRSVLALHSDKPEPSLVKLFAEDSLFHFDSRPATQIDFALLRNYDIIFCSGLRELSGALADALASYARDGGTLVMIPHSAPDAADAYNTLLSSLGVATYGAFDTAEVRLGSVNFDNTLFKGVYSEKPSNLAMPMIFRHSRINMTGSAGESVIMKMLNENPLLLSASAGKGQVFLFASSLNPLSTNLVAHAEIFVPPVYNMALYSGMVAPLYYISGADRSVTINYQEGAGQSVFRIRNLEGTQEFIPGHRNDPSGILLFFEDQISRAGNYQVLLDEAEVAPLAFNYSHQESDLRADSEKEIRQWIDRLGNKSVQIIRSGGRSVTEKLQELNDGVKLWRWFVMAALLFLAAEVLLLRFWRRKSIKTT